MTQTTLPFLYASALVRPVLAMPDATTREPGWGTGFLISAESTDVKAHLCTAAHVLDPARKYPKYAGARLDGVRVVQWARRYDTDEPLALQEWVLAAKNVRYADSHDVVVMTVVEDDILRVHGSGPINRLPASTLLPTSEFVSGSIYPGQDVLIPGYPGTTNTSPPSRPYLFSGTLISDPMNPASFNDGDHERELLLQAFSWGGSSGAPVLGVQRASKIIGVSVGHLNLGGDAAGVITRVVRSDVVLELL